MAGQVVGGLENFDPCNEMEALGHNFVDEVFIAFQQVGFVTSTTGKRANVSRHASDKRRIEAMNLLLLLNVTRPVHLIQLGLLHV